MVSQFHLTIILFEFQERHPFRYPEGRNPHWSSIVVAAHSESYSMWCDDCIASDGVEVLAEAGSTNVRTIKNAVY